LALRKIVIPWWSQLRVTNGNQNRYRHFTTKVAKSTQAKNSQVNSETFVSVACGEVSRTMRFVVTRTYLLIHDLGIGAQQNFRKPRKLSTEDVR
jgi:hypothetical protein